MKYLSYPILLTLLVLILGSLSSVLIISYNSSFVFEIDSYLYEIVKFSLRQSFLSSLISLIIGITITRSYIHSSDSIIKRFVEKAFGLPFVLPTMVMIQILLHMFGHNGWFNLPFSLYSEKGIILTHVILNVPFVVFLMKQVWQTIPNEHWRLAKQLNFNSWQFWKMVEWPVLKTYLPHAFIPVFLLCFTSFTPVLILSPTPINVTLEVAIYQSVMFELDFGNVISFIILQIVIGTIVVLITPNLFNFRHEKTNYKIKNISIVSKKEIIFHNIIIFIILFLLILMGSALIETTLKANMSEVYLSEKFIMALIRSTLIACVAGMIGTFASIGLLKFPFIQKAQSYISIFPMLIPSVTLGSGLYIFIGRYFPDLSLIFVVLLNAIIGLPFSLRILQGSLNTIRKRYEQRIIESRLNSDQQWELIEKPLLFPSLRLSFALITTISFGDLGAIILFNSNENPTLTALMYQYIEAFDMHSSSCVALALLVCTGGLFFIIQNIGMPNARN